jgi:hypothetical protein
MAIGYKTGALLSLLHFSVEFSLLPQFVVKMKLISVAAALLPLASGAMFSQQEYESGQVMAVMMQAKEACTLSTFRPLLMR